MPKIYGRFGYGTIIETFRFHLAIFPHMIELLSNYFSISMLG